MLASCLCYSVGDAETTEREKVDKAKLSVKRKAETVTPSGLPLKRGPGRPRKDRTQEGYLTPSALTPAGMPQVGLRK